MKRMTNAAVLAMLLAAVLLLSGCQLAKEEAQAENSRMIGVFITTECLDLFDWEAYLNDNIGSLRGDTVLDPGESAAYEGRIYASAVEKEDHMEYSFEPLEGMGLYAYTVPASDSNPNPYTATSGGEGISDVHFNSKTDGEELTGTIYHIPTDNLVFYFNPVYQTEAGEVYLTAGQGLATNSFGGEMSHSMKESFTVTENGEELTGTNSNNITIVCAAPPETVVVLQMDAGSNILARQEYLPDEMPESLRPDSSCAYLLVENHSDADRVPEGAQPVERTLYARQTDSFIRTLYDRGDGICLFRYTALEW